MNKRSGSDCVLGRQPFEGHSGTCLHGSKHLGGVCSDLSPCSRGTCVYNPALGVSQCSDGDRWSLCTSDDHCAPDYDNAKRTCLVNPEYPDDIGVCSSSKYGEPCEFGSNCTGASGECDKPRGYLYTFGYCK